MPNAVLPPPLPACGPVHGGRGSAVRASQRPCHGVRVDVEVVVVVFGLVRLTSVSRLQEAGVRVLERVAELGPQAVYVSALPPAAVLHASFLCKRLRPRFPDLKIVVALWHAQGDVEKGRARLLAAGASEVVVTLKGCVQNVADDTVRWSDDMRMAGK